MTSTLGKPGEPLPSHLFDGERHDAECQPRVTEYLGTVKLEIPMNNPYWRQCSTEPGASVTALHALSFAAPHAPQEVSHEQLDALWVGQCERPETRVWLKAEALRLIDEAIAPALRAWAGRDEGRLARARLLFALDGARWNEERVLDRYELLYEAGLAPEADRDRANQRVGIANLTINMFEAFEVAMRDLITSINGLPRTDAQATCHPALNSLYNNLHVIHTSLVELRRTVQQDL